MENVFLLLFLASFACLFLGLLSPSLFSRFLKERATRKNLSVIFGIAIIIFFILFGVATEPTSKEISKNTLHNQQPEKIQEDKNVEVSFNEKSRIRFNEIKESFPELESIECYNEDCTSLVYFNLSSIPEDLDFAIRGNTATFSKFKLDNTGVSHVTIIAKYNGRILLQCNGSKGKVDECN